MTELFQIFSLPNVWWVLSGATLLGGCLGAVGAYAFLKREALIGDVLSHAALPGVMTAFLIFHSRHPAVILSGAVISCLITSALIHVFTSYSRLKPDAVLATLLSSTFAIGMFQLTIIQQKAISNSAGLDRLLFGQAAAMRLGDITFYVIVATVLLGILYFFSRELMVVVFDPWFGRSLGMPVGGYRLFLACAAAIAVAISLDLAGVVLVAALLLTPAAAARQWARSVPRLVLLSGVFGGLSGVLGSLASTLRPGMPTGPWIVVFATAIFVVSLLFATDRGIIPRLVRRLKLKEVIAKENALRTAFRVIEAKPENGGDERIVPLSEIREKREFSPSYFKKLLRKMERENYIVVRGDTLELTENGYRLGEKLTRYHRLWELYLSKFTPIPVTHLHADAEEAEHFLDEHLEEALLLALSDPEEDPHGQPIPSGGSS